MGYPALGGDSRRFRTQMNTCGLFAQSGAVAAAVVTADAPAPPVGERFRKWLTMGHNAGMEYMERYFEIRMNPQLLLEGARSVVALAFNYNPAERRDVRLPQIASFAFGLDYHDVIRQRLQNCVSGLKNAIGGDYRICIDSAPVFDRLWAELSGIGSRCDNGLIYIPGIGTRVVLAEVFCTHDALTISRAAGIPTGVPCRTDDACNHCWACRLACPTGALLPDGTVDARRCLSYLTIEHRGQWKGESLEIMRSEKGRGTLFGCDICQNVCHLNRRRPATEIPEFQSLKGILTLTAQEVASMTPEEFSRRFKGSAVKRARLAGLRRNALNSLGADAEEPPVQGS